MLVFDLETNGLLPGSGKGEPVSKIHCMNMVDTVNGQQYRFTDHEFYQDVEGRTTDVPTPRDGTLKDGLAVLKNAASSVMGIAGHNIIGYDLPVLRYLTGDNTIPTIGFDTYTLGKLAYPLLKDMDFNNVRKGKLPAAFYAGGLSLAQWGVRFGVEQKANFKPKDYGHTWETIPFIKDMDDYCMQDCVANAVVVNRFRERNMSQQAIDLELGVARVITLQQRHGVRFDEKAAEKLAEKLYTKSHSLREKAQQSFSAFYIKDGKKKTPAKPHRRFIVDDRGAVTRKVKGETQRGWWNTTSGEHQPIKMVAFNPGSRMQIENRLRWKYDWEPTDYTPTGRAKIDEDTLGSLPFKEAQGIAEYFTVTKRLGQLSDGDNAWLKKVRNGRMYGRVDQLGTVTGRMSHFSPNLGQVPANHNPYGPECRALFIADADRVMVGCDADALELRVLAHFLARFDDGAYIAIVLEGSKDDGTDMHSRTRDALKLIEREVAKTWFYAFIYGAGDFKLGTIVMTDWDEAKLIKFYKAFPPGQKRQSRIASLGRRSRSRLIATMPAFGRLSKAVQKAAARGWLRGLDGRRLPVRAMHAAINTLCQSAGAIVMKLALVIMFDEFDEKGLDVIPLLNVHDEVQLSCLKEEADSVGRIASEAIVEAGKRFDFRCPLGADYKVGTNWSETH